MIIGGGEMGARIRALNWSENTLGPMEAWPVSLRNAVNLMLQSPAPLVLLWGAPGITFYNDAYAVFAADRHPALLGAACEHVWPGAADFIRNIKARCLQGETITYSKLRFEVFRDQKPETIWMDLFCSPLADDGGNWAGAFIVTTETTNYVNTEIALQASEERFSSIFNQTSVGIAETDLTGKFVLVNERFCTMVGRSPAELYQLHMQEISHPEEIANNVLLFKRAISEGVPFIIEKRYIRPDGSEIWVNNTVSLIKGKDGSPQFIVAIVQEITERKRVEEALKESEERFRIMAEASGLLIAHTDEAGNAIYFNKEWLNLTGRSLSELIQDGWVEFLHPDDRTGFVDAYRNAVYHKVALKQEFRLLKKDGSYSWQLGIITPRFGLNGTFAGFISSCVDITELKHAQEALTKSEDRFRTFADNIQNLAWMAEPDGWIFWYNQQWYDYTGTNLEQMQGWGWGQVHHPDHVDRVVNFVKEAWIKGDTFELTFPLKGANGEFRWFLTRGYAVKDKAGKVVRWIGTNTDIHEQKIAEEELKKFKILSDYAFDAFILMREDGSFAYLNDLARQRWGYTLEEVLTLRVPDVDPIYQEEKFNQAFAQAQLQGALPTFETMHKRKDGTVFPVEVSMGGIILEGKPHLFAVARDITERRQTEETLRKRNEELQRTNNDLDNFIYTASHDLKAPILNIEALVNVLVTDLPAESLQIADVGKVIALISDSVGRFKNTIKDLTDLTKLQRFMESDVSQLTIAEVFEEVRLDLQIPLLESGATLETDFSQCAFLRFSRKNMRSIIYNLVSNAIKYHSPERAPIIRVSTQLEAQKCVLVVEDNGLGMDMSSQGDKIFSMFRRLHDHVEGSGIGLYIVKRIVDNHGGRITVESEVGKGSTFRIYFNGSYT